MKTSRFTKRAHTIPFFVSRTKTNASTFSAAMPKTNTTTAKRVSRTERKRQNQQNALKKISASSTRKHGELHASVSLDKADHPRAVAAQERFKRTHERDASHKDPIDGRWVPFAWVTPSNATVHLHSGSEPIDSAGSKLALTPYGCFDGRKGTLSVRVRELTDLDITINLKSFLQVKDMSQVFSLFDSTYTKDVHSDGPRRAVAHAHKRRCL